MPLVWAHAEYIKLLRSKRDRAIWDLIEPVRERYIVEGVKSDVQVWLFNHKLRAARADRPLRFELDAPARLHWTINEWVTVEDTEFIDEGLGVYTCDFAAGTFKAGDVLKFTFFWTRDNRWEGRDFDIAIQ